MSLACIFSTGQLLAQSTLGQTTPTGGTDQLLVWAIVLIGVAVVLFFAELFVPSGGILGLIAATCLIAGIVMLFQFDTVWGIIGIIASLIALPFAFSLGLWVWPSTPIGRALTLGGNDKDTNALDGQAPPDTTSHDAEVPVGTEGKALTELRPVGTCLFEGGRHECLSVTGVVEPGTQVKVVSSDGMQIKVKPADG